MPGVLFLIDYDGTLAPENESIDAEVLEKLRSIKESSGARLVVATARPLGDMRKFIPRPRVFDAFLLELGSAIYFPLSGELVLFKPDYWDSLVEVLKRALPPANVGSVLYYFDETVLEQARRLLESAKTYPADVVKVGSRTYVAAPPGLSKKLGVERLLRVSGWEPSLKVAIGDSLSDIPLFEVSDLRVAVGNAHPSLKRIADFVASGSMAAGVLEAISYVIKKNAADSREERPDQL
ncbi:MAG: HAD family hydrolase [Thermofilum sp.]